jgi:hypothetical protein
MNEKVKNVVLALIYEIICIPLMTIFTKNLISTSLVNSNNNNILFIIFAVLIIALNIAVIYAIAYVYNNVLKIKNVYYIAIGIVGILAMGAVYYFTYKGNPATCTGTAIECLDKLSKSKNAIVPFVASVSYFAFYLLLSRIAILNFRNKKQEMNNKMSGV